MTVLATFDVAVPQVEGLVPHGQRGQHGQHGQHGQRSGPRAQGFWSLWIFVLAFVVRLPAMWAPPFVRHPWRQTQTAFTIREFARNGIDLFYPHVPVVGRPWVLVYEFPLFQAIAAALMRLGASAEMTGRWVAVACFFATAVLLGQLGHRVLEPQQVRTVQAVFLFSPFGLFWSRAVLVEYLATAFTLLAILAFSKVTRSARTEWFAVGVVSTVAAALVKSSTPIVMLPLAIVCVWTGSADVRRRVSVMAALVASTLATAMLWTAFADQLKNSNPLTAPMTTSGMIRESVTTLTSGAVWSLRGIPWAAVVHEQIGGIAVLFIVGLVTLICRNPIRWAALATPVFGFVLFPVQFGVHNYYSAATSPAVAIAVGCALADLRTRSRRRLLKLTVVPLWLIACILSSAWTVRLTYVPPWRTDHPNDEILAREVRAFTSPGAMIAAMGVTWSPAWMYSADRRGLIILAPAGRGYSNAVRAELQRSDYGAVVLGTAAPKDGRLLRVFRWIGAVSGQLALVGPDEKNVRQARFLVADEALPIGHPVREAPASLQCDGVATIPLHRSGVNVVRFGPTGRDLWLRVGHGLADLPIRGTAIISNTTPGNSEILDAIRCVGGGTIDVLGAGIRLKTAL